MQDNQDYLKELEQLPNYPTLFETYKKQLIQKARNAVLFSLIVLLVFGYFALSTKAVIIFVVINGIAIIFNLIDYYNSYHLKKLIVEKDVFLSISYNDSRNTAIQLQKAGKTGGIAAKNLYTVAPNTEVYLIRAGKSKTLMAVFPVEGAASFVP